jgi:hypothetical protein
MEKEWLTQLQQSGSKADNRFIIDVDNPAIAEDVCEELRERATIHTTRETPNGQHVVTEPFDCTSLPFKEDDLDVKTDWLLFVSFLDYQ